MNTTAYCLIIHDPSYTLQEDAREDVYIENIDAHYEDMESLNKLNITHTRCVNKVMRLILFYLFYSNELIIKYYLLQSNCLEKSHSAGDDLSTPHNNAGTRILE